MKSALYSQVVDDLRQRIRSGQLVDRIPPENKLARSFQVSVSTVKKALAILEAEDLIVRLQGRGTFVRSEAGQVPELSDLANEEEQPKQQLNEQSREQLKEELKEQFNEPPATETMHRVETVRRIETVRHSTDKPMVGVILPEAQDGFSRRLLGGVFEALSANGIHTLVDFSGGDRTRESEIVASFLQKGVDGLIVFPGDGEIYNKDLVLLSFEGFPLVLIDRWFPGIDVSRVVSQNANGVEEAVNALYAAGHRNMALVYSGVFPAATESIVERKKGFLAALEANGISATEEALWLQKVKPDDERQNALEYLVIKLREHPEVTALVVISTRDVLVAFDAAKLACRSVPRDLSIAGFDIGADFVGFGAMFGGKMDDSPVAWIDQSEVDIGKEAAGLVSRLIAGSSKTEVIEVPAAFHWGRTCGAAPASQDVCHSEVEGANR